MIFSPSDGISWQLRWSSEENRLLWSLTHTPRELGAMFELDLRRGQNTGLLELGSNNIEGRIPWSQVYYLNGFFDLFWLATNDEQAFEAFKHLKKPVRRRLDIELALLDAVLSTPTYYSSRAFTYCKSRTRYLCRAK